MKFRKHFNLLKNYLRAYIDGTTFFVRVIPTDECNMNCAYCFQKRANAPHMEWLLFEQVIEKAKGMKVGVVSFLGGEPMLWAHIFDALSLCMRQNILTDMTTNGSLLNEESMQKLCCAGLDYLNISVDTRDNFLISEKNSPFDKKIMRELKAINRRGTKVRMNGVISRSNFEDIKLLMELSNENRIPVSLGFIVPGAVVDEKNQHYFTDADTAQLTEIVDYILSKKRSGFPIIDPDSYFENVFKFIAREAFWKCNYPSKYGWINVTANGKIRSCTKKMDETGYDFIALTPEELRHYKNELQAEVELCNRQCYSNCAYYSAHYRKNKTAFFVDNFKKIF